MNANNIRCRRESDQWAQTAADLRAAGFPAEAKVAERIARDFATEARRQGEYERATRKRRTAWARQCAASPEARESAI